MTSIKELLKSLVVSLGDPKEPARVLMEDVWKEVFPEGTKEQIFLDALYEALQDEAGSNEAPWTKEDLRAILRYEVDLSDLQLRDLGNSDFLQRIMGAFEDVALVPSQTRTDLDFEQIARNVVKRARAKFVEKISSDANTQVFWAMLAQHAADQGLKVDELYAFFVEGYPQLKTNLTAVHRRMEMVYSTNENTLAKVCALESKVVQLQRTLSQRSRQQPRTFGSPEVQQQSLQRRLEDYQENLHLLRERIAKFVSPRDVPLQINKDIALIERRVAEIKRELTLDANSSH